MKRDNLKKYFTLAALLTAFTFSGFAQASEETENSKEAEGTTAGTEVKVDKKDDSEETKEEVINTVKITSNDVYYSEAEQEEGNGDTDGYAGNNFGSYEEGQVTKQTPITIFPNPMVTSATIRFYNPDKSAVTIDVYDNLGRVVLHVPDLLDYEYNIDKNVIPEGIYYVKIKKKTSGDGDDDDDDTNMLVKEDNTQNDVIIYSAKLVVN